MKRWILDIFREKEKLIIIRKREMMVTIGNQVRYVCLRLKRIKVVLTGSDRKLHRPFMTKLKQRAVLLMRKIKLSLTGFNPAAQKSSILT